MQHFTATVVIKYVSKFVISYWSFYVPAIIGVIGYFCLIVLTIYSFSANIYNYTTQVRAHTNDNI